jgi:phosphoadenosine phosphosulfate reductase
MTQSATIESSQTGLAKPPPRPLFSSQGDYREHLADAEATLEWAREAFGDDVILTSSFGAESAVMLHLVTRFLPNVRVVFVDTGFLFPETYRFVDQLRERFSLNLYTYVPVITAARLLATYGPIWEEGEDGIKMYNQLTKVEPTNRALRELQPKAWFAGLRSNQTQFRSGLSKIEEQDGVSKISPILDWTTSDVATYMAANDLPYHPLFHKGYRSIGDVHSTFPTKEGEDPRAGRRLGTTGECGMHAGSCKK